jgi:polar amino acid transport system substrate-binding protein
MPRAPQPCRRPLSPFSLVGTVAVGVAMALTATACGSGSSPSSGASSHPAPRATVVDAALVATLPAAVRAKGTLVVGVDATYAPNEFLGPDGQTVEGMDVDLFDAVAAQLGLRVQWVPTPFDSIIGAVSHGTYDVGVSSFSVTPDRLKQVRMVSYFSAGTQWATAKGNPHHVSLAAACGLAVAVQQATTQADDIAARSHACTAAGHAAIKVTAYSGQDQATASVVSGRNVALLADSPITAYAIKSTHGKLQPVGAIYDAAPYGYVVPKKDSALATAIAGALKRLQSTGAYKRILDRWGSASGAVSSFSVS